MTITFIRTHHEEFEGSFANYDLNEVSKKPRSRVNMAYIPGALRYLAGLLSLEAEVLDSQRWTVIPIGKLQMAFVPVDIIVLYWVCRLAHEDPDIEFQALPALMVSHSFTCIENPNLIAVYYSVQLRGVGVTYSSQQRV